MESNLVVAQDWSFLSVADNSSICLGGFGRCWVSQQCNQIHSQRWSDNSSPSRVSWSQLGQGKDGERPAILSLARKPKITSLWLTPQASADSAAIQFATFSWSQGLCGFPEWVVNKSHSNFWRGRNHLALLRYTRHRYRYPRYAWCIFWLSQNFVFQFSVYKNLNAHSIAKAQNFLLTFFPSWELREKKDKEKKLSYGKCYTIELGFFLLWANFVVVCRWCTSNFVWEIYTSYHKWELWRHWLGFSYLQKSGKLFMCIFYVLLPFFCWQKISGVRKFSVKQNG